MPDQPSSHKLSIVRIALAGAATAAIFFVLCWLGALLPIGPATHMYLKLFTNAEATSAIALVQGVCWSIGFGLIVGGLFAWTYNLLARLGGD